jgi:phage gp29-like protein
MARPNTQTLHAPSTRVLPADQWSADLVRAAQVMADSGSLRLAAELCDVLLADDRVQGCLLALTRGFFGLELTFEDGVGLRRRRARRALEVEEDWWRALPEEDLSQLVSWGAVLGVGLGRLAWARERGRMIPRLEVWHPKHLRFDAHERRWWVQTQSGEVEIVPGDGSWVMYTPGGRERPWAHGAWRAIARWWLLKKYALGDWGRHSEQAGGVKVATTEGGSEADRRKLANDLAGMGQDAAVALPSGWDLKLVEATANTFETFRAQVDSANAAIAIALVGQNLSTEVQGGSFAAAQVHQQVAHAVLRGQAESLSTTLHEQVLAWWAEFNFGSRDVAPWPLWNTDPPEDNAALAATAKTVGEAVAAMKSAGVAVDVQEFAERFRIPLAKAPVGTAGGGEGQTLSARCGCGESHGALGASEPRLPPRVKEAQRYVDELVKDTAPRVQKAMEPIVRKVLEAIEGATSFDELKGRLEAMRGTFDERELAQVLADAAELAGYAGAWSAKE